MFQRLLILSVIALIWHCGLTTAQDRFELVVPGTTTRSTAELTATTLSIAHQGDVTVYSRDNRYDDADHFGFTSATQNQIIRWPRKGTGAMRIAAIPLLGVPQFRQSQMQIVRVAGPSTTIPGSIPGPIPGRPTVTTPRYRLTNAFLGPGRSLAADASGATAMAPSGNLSNQSWRFVKEGPERFRLTNDALGDGFSLAAQGRDARAAMVPTDLRSPAQMWRLTVLGAEVRLTNEAFGSGWSLDNDPGGLNDPILAASGNFTGQLWAMTELTAAAGPIDPNRNYRLTNAFLGAGRSLEADPRGMTAMGRSGDVASQSWRFVAVGPQTYRLTNAALGDGFSLTAQGRNARPIMQPTDLRSTAQLWRQTILGTGIRLTNEALGNGWSLDNFGDGANDPVVGASGLASGQEWTLIELPPAASLYGTWQEYEVATNRFSGITVEIRNDSTFLQTEVGQLDIVGTSRLVGDLLTLDFPGSRSEQFLTTQRADRVDFRSLAGTPTGFYWRRIATGGPAPTLGLPRLISSKVVPNPPLAPVTLELSNSHSEELWVLVTDLRDVTRVQRLKIPAGESASVELERDAGSRLVEIWDIPATGEQEQRESEVPAQQLYDISVYELFVQSIAIDRTGKSAKRIEDVNRSPKSVGLINVPPGDRMKGGKTDIYPVAKRQGNSGAVRRIDPKDWSGSLSGDDALEGLLKPGR
jgi:hypothetical protein